MHDVHSQTTLLYMYDDKVADISDDSVHRKIKHVWKVRQCTNGFHACPLDLRHTVDIGYEVVTTLTIPP
jgi:hypothetical protein